MKNQLDKINKNHSFIEKTEFTKDLLNKINYKFRLDWNYYSNHLEGGTLTKEETRSVMVDIIDIRGKSIKDVMEMRGHNEVITQIIKIGQAENRISERRIKDIHKAIMYEEDKEKAKEIGEWKTKPNEIINYKKEKIDFTKPSEVAGEMHTLLDRTNAQLDAYFANKKANHPIKIATNFHIKFLTIHPFYDGNGRTARILTNLILISCGYPPIIIKNENKATYYKLLADIQVYGGKIDLLENFLAERLLASQQLVLDAIAGKDIEEIDDLDKEITLWKNSLVSDDIVPLTPEILVDLYKNTLKPLFNLFIQKHRQFDDLFLENKTTNIINDRKKTVIGLEYFSEMIEKEVSLLEGEQLLDSILNDFHIDIDNINLLRLALKYNNFNKNGTNIFDNSDYIIVTFKKLKYTITTKKGDVFTKLYSETLTTTEINSIVNTTVKDFFTEIKSQIKTDK